MLDYFSLPAQRESDEEHLKFCFTITGPDGPTARMKGHPIAPIRDTPSIHIYGHLVRLTRAENVIFRALYQHGTRSYDQLIQSVWPDEGPYDPENALRKHLLELRKKLRARSSKPDEAEYDYKKPHCFLEIDWGRNARLQLEDVVTELDYHAQNEHNLPRTIL